MLQDIPLRMAQKSQSVISPVADKASQDCAFQIGRVVAISLQQGHTGDYWVGGGKTPRKNLAGKHDYHTQEQVKLYK